jgi:glyoxylase-like metal-dependent hydrolase (beta-lactamase superfamily II)
MEGNAFAEVWLKRLCAAGAALCILALVWMDAARNYKPAKEWRTTLGAKPVEMSPDGVLYYLGGATEDAAVSPPIPSYAIATYSGLILIDPLLDHRALAKTLSDFNLSSNAIGAIVLMNDAPARRAAALALAEETGAEVYALSHYSTDNTTDNPTHAANPGVENAWLEFGDRPREHSNIDSAEEPLTQKVLAHVSKAAVRPLRDGEVIRVGDTRLYIMAPPDGASPKACLFACILRRNILFTGDLLDELMSDGGRSSPQLSKRIAAGSIDLILPNAPWAGDEFDAELAARRWQERKSQLSLESDSHVEMGRRSEIGNRRSYLTDYAQESLLPAG